MIYILGALLLLAGSFIVWLVPTKRWQFPLMFDCGLVLLGFGILVNGIQIVSDGEPSLRAWATAGVGAALMLISYFRESRRKPELGGISRRIMRGPR